MDVFSWSMAYLYQTLTQFVCGWAVIIQYSLLANAVKIRYVSFPGPAQLSVAWELDMSSSLLIVKVPGLRRQWISNLVHNICILCTRKRAALLMSSLLVTAEVHQHMYLLCITDAMPIRHPA